MRILFYLPVVAPWWFENIVEPLIRVLAVDAEVHVLAPAPWNNTGIGPQELERCADLTSVRWHIVDGPGHEGMRENPADRDAIVDFVRALAPDYVFARAADCETVGQFPGKIRYLMEGGVPPFRLHYHWIILQQQPFDHGCLPDLDASQRAELDALIAPAWDHLQAAFRPAPGAREAFRAWAQLPSDRPVIAVPLEFEGPENFFPSQRVGARKNANLVAEIVAELGPRFFIALTNHPLNALEADNTALEAEVAQHGGQLRLVPTQTPWGESSTTLLARDADAVLVGDSKSYANCAFFGTPTLRRTRFETGAWLNAYSDFDSFLPAVAAGTAARPDLAQARTWFAFHILNNALDPRDPTLTAAELLGRVDNPVDPARWPAAAARLRQAMPEAFQ